MIREIKYLLFIISIVLFLFLTIKYYFSDQHIKNSYRSMNNIEKKLNSFSKNLPILKSDTVNIIEFVEQSNLKKKKYNFWKLLDFNE